MEEPARQARALRSAGMSWIGSPLKANGRTARDATTAAAGPLERLPE